MKKHKKKAGVLRSVLVTLAFSAIDLTMIYPFVETIHNESWLLTITSAVVMAGALDASPAIAGHLLAGAKPSRKTAKRRRLIALLTLGFCFVLSLGAVTVYAYLASRANGNDMLYDGSVPRLLLPVATSIISFYLSFKIDPVGDEIKKLDKQLHKTQVKLDETEAEIQRFEEGLKSFDPDSMDSAMLRAALAKLQILGLDAMQKVRGTMANLIDTPESNAGILGLDDKRESCLLEVEKTLRSLGDAPFTSSSESSPALKVLTAFEKAPDTTVTV